MRFWSFSSTIKKNVYDGDIHRRAHLQARAGLLAKKHGVAGQAFECTGDAWNMGNACAPWQVHWCPKVQGFRKQRPQVDTLEQAEIQSPRTPLTLRSEKILILTSAQPIP